MKTKVKINEKVEFELDDSTSGILLNGASAQFELKKIRNNLYFFMRDSKKYEIELVDSSLNNFTLIIDGVYHKIEIIDHQKQILKMLGMESTNEIIIDQLFSPMPGTILEVMCKKGDEVSKGDTLIILEAMKMENTIKAPANVVINEICISVGDNVEKNQTLILF